MKVELPTKDQLLRAIKYGALISIPGLALTAWLVHKDPVRTEAERYLRQSPEIAEVVGTVNSDSLTKATYVQSGIEYSGVRTPAYNLYRYKVSGTKRSAVATIRVEEPGTKNEVFSIAIER